MLPGMLAGVVQATADIMAEVARGIHEPHKLSGATYDSIESSGLMSMHGAYFAQVSVATPQAQFQEFGFVHHWSGQWISNPFMLPAADATTPFFVDAVNQVLSIAGNLRFFPSGGIAQASPANDMLGTVRKFLYSYSKFAGDIQVLGFSGLSASRGIAVKGAKGIGNIQAVRTGSIGGRLGRLGGGRLGSSAFRGGNFGGGLTSGPSGRIYNRISGRILGGGLKGI